MRFKFRTLVFAGALWGLAGCATVPNGNDEGVIVSSGEVNYTLAKGETLYTQEEVLGFLSGGSSTRHKAKFERRLSEAQYYALGTKRNPVRADKPYGQREYLNRLRCPMDGKSPNFERMGSFGAGPYETIIDGYEVKCRGEEPVNVFMDMYFSNHYETEAVPGFAIIMPSIGT